MSNPQDIVSEIHDIARTALDEGKQIWATPDAQAAAGRLENGLGDILAKCLAWIEAPAPATPEAPASTDTTTTPPATTE